MQAIDFFKAIHSEPIAMSRVKYHTLIITNIACSSSYEMSELEEKGLAATIYGAEDWEGFHGIEAHILDIEI